MIDRETALLLIGAGIALLSSLLTSIVSHLLSLRADRIKRVRDRADLEAAASIRGLGIDTTGVQTVQVLGTLNRIKAGQLPIRWLAASSPDDRDNQRVYEKLRSNPDFLRKYMGLYVAFVDGHFVDKDTDRSVLLRRVREAYPKQQVFVARVEEEEPTDMPPPEVED